MAKKIEDTRVLLSAYACEPGRGSEPGVGWNVAKSLSSRVKLTVLTRANNREVIEVSGEKWITDVEWIYYDVPRIITWWKKGSRGVQLYYWLWQIGIWLLLKGKHLNQQFDIVHHLTFGRCWIPSYLPLLKIPTVFGSVGGGEFCPEELRDIVEPSILKDERKKRWAIAFFSNFVLSSKCYKSYTIGLGATDQSARWLTKQGVKKVLVLPQSGIDVLEFDHFLQSNQHTEQQNSPFICFCASRLIPWKGVDIAIRAFAIAVNDLPDGSKLRIAGCGSEEIKLKELAVKLNINENVEFLGKLPKLDDVYREMSAADCFIHPAVSEAFGQSCIESLAVGTPVVCWDWAGPGLIVNHSVGAGVKVNGVEPISNFSKELIRLSQLNKLEKEKMAKESRARAAEDFSWNRLVDEYVSVYREIMGGSD